ncbi:LysE family translocator [Photobacterium sp. OFAV2-7]|uniref:LysE family translocator n=1 Tax=Photobacterium sp. OFAV2-7 TaxID=2917748 RepID=UPI001EF3FD2E|nr:LysE family translocator [Photobacterium sp. OFAV2-7]MCG7587584.1 LysE family translocator [Photobacterium sp. OFAV2-7]
MNYELWLGFILASLVILPIPGPTLLLVVSYALSHGRQAAIAVGAGVVLGDITAMTASLVGVGALLASSATLYTTFKWLGACYLIYLGIKQWRAPATAFSEAQNLNSNPIKIFAHTYVVTSLNPKTILFFVSFLPLFIDPNKNFVLQAFVYEVSFVTMAVITISLYGLLAVQARRLINTPTIQSKVNKTTGSFIIAAGVGALSWQQAK